MLGNPTAAQKRFHEWCREYGCVVNRSINPAIHHIKGSRMNLKGCKKAGEWYVLPLSYWWHQDGSNKAAIHVSKEMFQLETERTEKFHWVRLIEEYKAIHCEKPMSEEEYQIIVERA